MNWDAIVLAAGEGTRMRSDLPKVLHKVCGLPMILRAVRALDEAGAQNIHIVISEKIQKNLEFIKEQYPNVSFHIQKNPKGTADAVYSVKAKLSQNVFICNGDHPLINTEDVLDFVASAKASESKLIVGVLENEHPASFGRVIVDKKGLAEKIVEAKHCDDQELKIKTINTGIYFCDSKELFNFLEVKSKDNKNSEFYLTDIVEYLNSQDKNVVAFETTEDMAFGVNDSFALSMANQKAYQKYCHNLMNAGVRFINHNATYIDETVKVDVDVTFHPNVFVSGNSEIKSGTFIESGVYIKDSYIGPNSVIKAGSYIEDSKIHGESNIGPYAHLRPKSEIYEDVKVGNFAEIKKSVLRKGVKAGHQCYLGDADIGEGTNIGAGTITCNFAADEKKYKTFIGKNVFVGSDTQIVAPVSIKDDAVIAAGSTVTKDVESKSLYVTRAKVFVKPNYRK